MNRIAIYKSCADVTFAEVAAEIKWRYPNVNIQTGAKEFVDLMAVAIKHHPATEYKIKADAKLKLAFLISDAFTIHRRN